MRNILLALTILAVVFAGGCSPRSSDNTVALNAAPSPVPATPVPTASIPADGDYDGRGVVTKINMQLASVELDHEDIPGVMPPMLMEFYVSDKKMLDGLRVGDRVDFVLRYKHPTETIVKLSKSK